MSSLDVNDHDAYFSSIVTCRNLSAGMSLYLAASYAYYKLDRGPISDGLFDQLALMLRDNYDDIVHVHKPLVTMDDLRAGTLLLPEYPSRARAYAHFLLSQLQDATRLYPSVFVCPICAQLYAVHGWAQSYDTNKSGEIPVCTPSCRKSYLEFRTTLHRKKSFCVPENWYLFSVHPGGTDAADQVAARFKKLPVVFRSDLHPVGYLGGRVPDELTAEFRSVAGSVFARPAANYRTPLLLL